MGASVKTAIPTEADTRRFALSVAPHLRGGDVVELHGDLGAGKTTFVRYLFEAMGGELDEVTSPTFSIIDVHPIAAENAAAELFVHADLYRIDDPDDVPATGLGDYVEDLECVVAIEWPDVGRGLWQTAHRIEFQGTGAERRVAWTRP